MRVLFVHTFYKQIGGEISALRAEQKLLSERHEVETLFFSNKEVGKNKGIKSLTNLFYNSQSYKKLSQKIDDFSPDIIHIHNLFYEASPSILYAAKHKKIPVVLTLHNYRLICSNALLMRDSKICELCVNKTFSYHGIKHGCFQNSKLKTAVLTGVTGFHKIMRNWNNKVDRYIALSSFQKQRLLNSSLRLNESQINVKPNFVEDHGQGNYAEREDYYLFIGRLSSEKGISILLEAQKLTNFRLEIIGDGELSSLVSEAAEKNDNITFYGFRDREFVIEKLKKAKALIFPSIWFEGMPMVILESFSTATPIIISDTNNIKDFVSHKHNGLHFNSGNPKALSAAIQQFNSESNPSYYENAFLTYQEKYTGKTNLKLLEKIYQSAIEEANQHS